MPRTLAAAGLAALVLAAAAGGVWSLAAPGSGGARAVTLGVGPTPSVGALTGTVAKDVPLSWAAVPGAAGYVLRRYDETGLLTLIGGTCTGVVSATSCTDQNVALGLTWRYTVQAVNGLWLGTEGAAAVVTT